MFRGDGRGIRFRASKRGSPPFDSLKRASHSSRLAEQRAPRSTGSLSHRLGGARPRCIPFHLALELVLRDRSAFNREVGSERRVRRDCRTGAISSPASHLLLARVSGQPTTVGRRPQTRIRRSGCRSFAASWFICSFRGVRK